MCAGMVRVDGLGFTDSGLGFGAQDLLRTTHLRRTENALFGKQPIAFYETCYGCI